MPNDFYIGQKVRIRQWDDMLAEYGDNGDDILAPLVFVSNMSYLCGKEFIIRNLVAKDDAIQVLFEDYYEEDGASVDGFYVSTGMIEPIEPTPTNQPRFYEGQIIRIKSFETLVSELGADAHGLPKVAAGFVREMTDLCGREFVIKTVDQYCEYVSFTEHIRFTISTDMIEPIEPDMKDENNQKLDNFLSGFTAGV